MAERCKLNREATSTEMQRAMHKRFRGCRLLAMSGYDEAFKGYWELYWVGSNKLLGSLDPAGAACLCPATNDYFGTKLFGDVEALVANALDDVFPPLPRKRLYNRLRKKEHPQVMPKKVGARRTRK